MAIPKLPARRLQSSSVPSQGPANPNNIAVGEPPYHTDKCNVVIFGEAGAGKSSLVNLIAREDVAATSSDAKGCTSAVNAHEILTWNEKLNIKLFDTPGLDEGDQGEVPDWEARRILRKHVRTLMERDDLHLIIYCVRGQKAIQALRRNYEFIHSQVRGKVPIVLVVTSLESYDPDMERWWRLNENTIANFGMTFAGHACVTTGMVTQVKVTERGLNQSYDVVCKLIEQCRLSNAARNKHINAVLFGQAGAGKSSLVNLMAGDYVACTSSDMRSCTLHWQEYPIQIDGASYSVFDTVGLEEPHLGIPQYLDAVENAYTLIQNLDRQGGIDLLVFCMRADRLTTTLQTNYRLFHEFLCDKKVPVVLVITHLETEVGDMDAWWTRNMNNFRELKVHVAGHACITTTKGSYPERYEQSRTIIYNIVKEFTADGQKKAWKGGDSTFVSFLRQLRGLLVGKGKPHLRKDMVSRLTKRCGLSSDVAKQLADRIKNGKVE